MFRLNTAYLAQECLPQPARAHTPLVQVPTPSSFYTVLEALLCFEPSILM
jgi:hypothetical protein